MTDSSEPGVPNLDDRIPQPRGLGIKLFNVEGKKLNENGLNTQDFEFNSCNILELGSAQTALEIIGLRMLFPPIYVRIDRTDFVAFLGIKHGDPNALSAALDERADGPIQQLRSALYPSTLWTILTFSLCSIFFAIRSDVRFQTRELKPKRNTRNLRIDSVIISPSSLLLRLENYNDRSQSSSLLPSTPLVFSENVSPLLARIWMNKLDEFQIGLHEYYSKNAGTYELRAQLCENIEEQPVEDSRYAWDAGQFSTLFSNQVDFSKMYR